MKKIISVFLVFVLAVSAFSLIAFSEGSEAESGDGTALYVVNNTFSNIKNTFSAVKRAKKRIASSGSLKNDRNDPYKAVLIADTHADGDPFRDRTYVLRDALAGMTATVGRTDALVLAGDVTNCGDIKEYLNIRPKLSCFARAKKILPEMGNHDSWHHSDDPDYAKAKRNFKLFLKSCGIFSSKVYYSYSDRFCRYIVLGSEDTMNDMAVISVRQLEWLRAELNKAAESGKPTVVVCHQPLDGHNGGYSGWTDDGVGETSKAIEAALLDAAAQTDAPILHVSGHRHRAFNANSFEDAGDGLYYINLPSFEYSDGNPGAVLRIRDGKITLQGYYFGERREAEELYVTLE